MFSPLATGSTAASAGLINTPSTARDRKAALSHPQVCASVSRHCPGRWAMVLGPSHCFSLPFTYTRRAFFQQPFFFFFKYVVSSSSCLNTPSFLYVCFFKSVPLWGSSLFTPPDAPRCPTASLRCCFPAVQPLVGTGHAPSPGWAAVENCCQEPDLGVTPRQRLF